MYDLRDKNKFRQCVEEGEFFSPLLVKIKPSGKCNLKCLKCNYWRKEPNKSHPGLGTQRIVALIDELKTLGCQCVKLSGGEITMREDVVELVSHIKSKGIKVSMTTNGVLISRRLANDLLSAGLDKITISIDAHNSDIHDIIVGVKGAWDKTTAGLKLLQHYKHQMQSEIKITVAFVICTLNYQVADKMIDFVHNLGIDRLDYLALVENHLADSSIKMGKDQIHEFHLDILPRIIEKGDRQCVFLVNRDPFGINAKKTCGVESFYQRIPCYVPWYSFFVHFDGRVVPCCSNKDYVIGNVNSTSIAEIISSQKAREFRKMMTTPNKPTNCYFCYDEIGNNLKITKWLGNSN